jgi:uncharacterized protein YidB (DUF937 family)
MGLLDILNGMQNGPRGQTQPGKGGMSPITMAMLALLAYKAYQKMGKSETNTAPNTGSTTGGGDLGGMLGSILGGGGAGGLGGLLQGGLGGLLGGAAAGGVLSGGLNDLLKQLQQAGHGDAAQSWVGTGPNQNISPNDLGKALGDDTVTSLAEQAGLSKVDLLNGMSEQLPQLVDHLTPRGSVPDEHEMSKLL